MLKKNTFALLLILVLFPAVTSAGNVTEVYVDRAGFESALESFTTEDFNAIEVGPDNFEVINDVNMSEIYTSDTGVESETITTGWDGQHIVYDARPGNLGKCGGCNGSESYEFLEPVSAFGLEVLQAWGGPGQDERWVAHLERCNGTTEDILVPHLFNAGRRGMKEVESPSRGTVYVPLLGEDEETAFFGILVPDGCIRKVHFGGPGGDPTTEGEWLTDNHVLGRVAQPPLFENGFESGDLSGWSSSTGGG